MKKDKKKFKDTKFGQFLSKAAKKIPDVIEVAAAVKSGNPIAVFNEAKDLFSKAEKQTDDLEVKALVSEFRENEALFQHELDMYALEVQDREGARQMQIENAKAGRTDWMYLATGTVIIIVFGICAYAIIFLNIPVENREMFTHLLGMVEGAFIGGMVNFFFGSSKGSKEKQEMIDKLGNKP